MDNHIQKTREWDARYGGGLREQTRGCHTRILNHPLIFVNFSAILVLLAPYSSMAEQLPFKQLT